MSALLFPPLPAVTSGLPRHDRCVPLKEVMGKRKKLLQEVGGGRNGAAASAPHLADAPTPCGRVRAPAAPGVRAWHDGRRRRGGDVDSVWHLQGRGHAER